MKILFASKKLEIGDTAYVLKIIYKTESAYSVLPISCKVICINLKRIFEERRKRFVYKRKLFSVAKLEIDLITHCGLSQIFVLKFNFVKNSAKSRNDLMFAPKSNC